MNTVVLFFAAIPVAIWRAFVLSVLWGWFLVPMGAPAIGVALAYGLLLVVEVAKPARPDPDNVAETLVFSALLNALVLATGYLVHLILGGAA